MRIVVCIKQVPGTTEVKIDPETRTLIRSGITNVINPFDTYALEEAMRIRERLGEGEVIAMTMGPPQAVDILKEALSLGVDHGRLISDRAFAGSDTLATAYALSLAVKKLAEVDLILCGKQAIDGDTAQVGPSLAERLGIPYITWVRRVRKIDRHRVVAERMMDDGCEVVEAPLPALLTVVKDINLPRVPSLRGKMRARDTQIPIWNAEILAPEPQQVGLDGSPTQVANIFIPTVKGRGELFKGTVAEQVDQLYNRLESLNIV